jgi:tetratricopeptide (TPR) repeat protein
MPMTSSEVNRAASFGNTIRGVPIPQQHQQWLAIASASPLEAIPQLVEALAQARLDKNVPDQIASLRALGMAERSRMRLAESIDHLETAIELAEELDDPVVAGHCRNTLAGSLVYAGRAIESLELMDRVIFDLPEPDRTQASAQLVSILSLAGFQLDALKLSETLLDQFSEAHEAVWAARIRQSRSMIHLYLGDPVSGLADAGAAIKIYESMGNSAGVARTRHNVAALTGLQGNVIGALSMFAEVEAEFKRLDIPLSLGSDGRVATLFAAGLAEDAADEARSAMKAAEAQGADGLLVEAAVWHALALAHLGRWSDVVQAAGLARKAFARQSRPAWRAFAAALEVEGQVGGLLGAALMCVSQDAGYADGWHRIAHEAAVEMRVHGWVQATRAEVLAALVSGAHNPAIGSLRLRELSGLRSAVIIEHQLLGWLAAGANEALTDPSIDGLVRAADLWRKGAQLGSSDAVTLASLDANLVVNSVQHTLAIAGVTALLRAGKAHEAFLWIEHERAIPVTPRLEPGLDQSEEGLLTELRALRIQAASPNTGEQVRDLIARQSELERQLRTQSVGVRSQPIAYETTQHEGLDVSFVIDQESLCALVSLHGGEARLFPLGALGPIHRIARHVRTAAERLSLGAAQWSSIEAPLISDLSQLDALLVAPWESLIPMSDSPLLNSPLLDSPLLDSPLLDSSVVDVSLLIRISAPAELDIPWCALPTLRHHVVAIVSSLHERQPPRPFADQLDQDAHRLRTVVIAGPRLSHATHEASVIAETRETLNIVAEHATRDAVKHALANAHTVHLACHAHLRHDQPLFSSLELHDGPLFLHDLARSDSVASIIILSACNAGQTSRRASGGAAGFARTLRSLGADVVIAPLVPVNDELMVAPMRELHRMLAAGVSAVEAMRMLRCARDTGPADRRNSLTPAESFTAAMSVPFAAGRSLLR